MTPRAASSWIVTWVMILLVATGCGQARFPVRGTVIYDDGSPYGGGGFVVAEATVEGKPVMARGIIGTDGRFELTGRNAREGVLAGSYRVRMLPPPLSGGIDAPAAASLGFDRRFLQFETSGLTLDVGRAGEELTIRVGARPPR